MKKGLVLAALTMALLLTLVSSSVYAAPPELPKEGLLWAAIDDLQQQIDALAQRVTDEIEALHSEVGLELQALRLQIDADLAAQVALISACLDDLQGQIDDIV
ncbi:MAG: hypothetical protein M0R22_05480, partial [Dehalococcoidia bacterium]|nr:hypothetical protein [Dehalococcoidia bacterium]